MATFFGRPLGELVSNIGIAVGISAVTGAAAGYYRGVREGDDDPTQRAKRTAGEWALTDAVIEAGLGIVAPGIRDGGVLRSTLVSSAIGGGSGFLEGYTTAKLHHADDPVHHGLTTAAQWAAIDAGVELASNGVFPDLRKFVKK